MSGSRTAVIIAMADDRAPIEACLAGFRREIGAGAGAGGFLVVVDASRESQEPRLKQVCPEARIVRAEPGSLVPELWTLGLRAIEVDSDSDLKTSWDCAAFTVAAMSPAPGWLAAMRNALETSAAAGIGGSIEPAEGLSATDHAIHRLRFARYARSRMSKDSPDPSGENAVYRRSALRDVEASAMDGFWEVEVQKRLRARGETFANAPDAELRYLGGGRLRSMLAQRWRHASRFAQDRSRFWSLGRRWARAAMFPAIPPLLLARALRGDNVGGIKLPAVPAIFAMSSAWALGEAFGLLMPGKPKGEA